MKRTACVVVVVAWLVAVAGLARGEQASVLLEKGIYTEETLGDPSAAIPLFEQAMADSQADRQVAAQAQFHLAMCHKALKQDAKARELLRQFVQRYEDQEALVAKAKPILEELTEFDPATLMPPDTFVYVELGSPGEQLEKILKMLEGTPLANPLEAVTQRSAVTAEQPTTGLRAPEVAPSPPPVPDYSRLHAKDKTPGQVLQALLNPSMLKEFKKLRSAVGGVNGFGTSGQPPSFVAVLQPGESDAIRGILTAAMLAQGQPIEPIEQMQTVSLDREVACAFDDEVFIIAAPVSRLTWAVRQYKGATEPSLATATPSFAALAPAASRRHDAVTIWADPARLLEAARPMIGRGGMRDLAMLTALADVPNMEGVVGRLRLVENGAIFEATVAYKPAHRSLFYDLIRTPPMSGEAFAAVPPTAAAVVGVALQPPGAAGDPSAAPDARTELVRHVTGLDLGRELFNNIQEIVVFLDLPGEGFADAAGRGITWWELAARSLGVVIVSRDPAQTRAVLDRLLALPETLSGLASTQPASHRTEYDLARDGRDRLTVYLAQQGHTTFLALDPKVHVAAMEALRSGRNARTAGPLAKVLPDLQGDSKVVVVNVGGILRLVDAANPPPPTPQPTSAPASQPPASTLAQLATAFADTTVRLETVERDEAFTIRLTVSDIPPLKDVFPLITHLQQKQAEMNRAEAQARRMRARMMARQAGMEDEARVARQNPAYGACSAFLQALGRRDLAAAREVVLPGSPADAALSDILTKDDFFWYETTRRMGSDERIIAMAVKRPDSGGDLLNALFIQLRRLGGDQWRVTNVDYVPAGQAQAEFDQFPSGPLAKRGEPQPKTLQPTADEFLIALARRDQAAIRVHILPGSSAEGKVNDILAKADFTTFDVQRVRRSGDQGVALAVEEASGGTTPQRALIFRLVLVEAAPWRAIWRVTDLDCLPLEQAQERMKEPLPQPSTQPAGASATVESR